MGEPVPAPDQLTWPLMKPGWFSRWSWLIALILVLVAMVAVALPQLLRLSEDRSCGSGQVNAARCSAHIGT